MVIADSIAIIVTWWHLGRRNAGGARHQKLPRMTFSDVILRDGERCYVYSGRSELNMSSTGTIYFRHVRTEVLALGIDMLIHSYSILSILNLSHLLLTSLNVSLLGCDLRHNKLTLVFSTLDRRHQKRYQLYQRIQRAVSAHKSSSCVSADLRLLQG